jgi:hypothetical protein
VETENGITLSTQPGWNARSAWNLGTKHNQEANELFYIYKNQDNENATDNKD